MCIKYHFNYWIKINTFQLSECYITCILRWNLFTNIKPNEGAHVCCTLHVWSGIWIHYYAFICKSILITINEWVKWDGKMFIKKNVRNSFEWQWQCFGIKFDPVLDMYVWNQNHSKVCTSFKREIGVSVWLF